MSQRDHVLRFDKFSFPIYKRKDRKSIYTVNIILLLLKLHRESRTYLSTFLGKLRNHLHSETKISVVNNRKNINTKVLISIH